MPATQEHTSRPTGNDLNDVLFLESLTPEKQEDLLQGISASQAIMGRPDSYTRNDVRILWFSGVQAEALDSLEVPRDTGALSWFVGAVSKFTDRQGDDVLRFLIAHLDEEEKSSLLSDLGQAAGDAVKTGSLAPIAQCFADWEATVSIRLDPLLSQELHEAIREARAEGLTELD